MDEAVSLERVRRWGLAGAELFDSWRTYPRFIIYLFGYLVWDVWQWFKHLPGVTPMEASVFAGSVFGMAAAVLALYLQGGRNWDKLEEIKCSQK